MSYKAYMQFATQAPASNALVFETKEEAEKYGADLFCRWTVPTGYEVRESEEAPNYRWVDGVGIEAIDVSVSRVEEIDKAAIHHEKGKP